MSQDRFDVIVVGARCAGSPLATLLARAGLRVCLLDRARFPSDTPSTHGIQPSGVKLLERLGVRDAVAQVGARVDRGTVIFDDVTFEIDGVSEQFGAPMINIRRRALDEILLDAAASAGAEVRTAIPVTGLLQERGRVVGVDTPKGPLRAALVVGADGARSAIARFAGAREYARTPAERAFLWAYFDGAEADVDRVWLGGTAHHGFLASFTDGGLFMAAVAPPLKQWASLRGDRRAAHAAALCHWPQLQECVANARRVGPVQAMAHWHGFFRESVGPGWVLVGDAGHFKDPSPGQGISDALRQAFSLAPMIERALGDGRQPERVLRKWWRWRDRDAWAMYWFAHDMGAERPAPAVVREIRRRIAEEPQLARGLLSVLNHDIPPSRVFTPRVLLSSAAHVWRSGTQPRRLVLRETGALAATAAHRASRALTATLAVR